MEKIKKYNQILLAIGGTLTLMFLIIIGLFILMDELAYKFNNTEIYDGIISTEETNELLNDSLRKQIISFNSINIIDSTNKIYVLPVRQANVIQGESVDELLGLTNTFTGGGRYFEKYSYYKNATYNNIIIYESINNSSKIIFKKRISISEYDIIKDENNIYILIIGTDKDSNQDKYINRDDLQNLFIYEVNENKLTKISFNENFTTLNTFRNNKSNDIFGKFGLDRNANGKFEVGKEPMIFYKIHLETRSLINIVQDQQIDTLQQLLEGR